MITIEEWNTLDWPIKNRIISKYKIGRSAPTRVVSLSSGVDSVVDDGIRQGDLSIFKNLKLQDIVASLDIVLGAAKAPRKEAEAVEVIEATKATKATKAMKKIKPKEIGKTKKATAKKIVGNKTGKKILKKNK